jgi:hypothetical protein
MGKTLFSFTSILFFTCSSAIVQAALPISSVQTTGFDSVVSTPPFGDIVPPNNVIDDLTYEKWRYETVLAPSPGIISHNSPSDADISTTPIKIRTDDGSQFRAISIDYSAYAGFGSPYDLALYGYLAGTQVSGYVISRSSVAPGGSETLTLNWDNIDEIRVAVDSDFVVFDNVTVGPATATSSATVTPIPTISTYGLIFTAMSLLFVAGYRLRTSRNS